MKIIKQGKSKEEIEAVLKNEKRFQCATCDCIFSANDDEYRYDQDYIYTTCYCKCPNCGRTVKRLRKNYYQVSCTNPWCFSVEAVCADTEEQAIIAWNKRRENDEP